MLCTQGPSPGCCRQVAKWTDTGCWCAETGKQLLEALGPVQVGVWRCGVVCMGCVGAVCRTNHVHTGSTGMRKRLEALGPVGACKCTACGFEHSRRCEGGRTFPGGAQTQAGKCWRCWSGAGGQQWLGGLGVVGAGWCLVGKPVGVGKRQILSLAAPSLPLPSIQTVRSSPCPQTRLRASVLP